MQLQNNLIQGQVFWIFRATDFFKFPSYKKRTLEEARGH